MVDDFCTAVFAASFAKLALVMVELENLFPHVLPSPRVVPRRLPPIGYELLQVQ